MIKSLLNAFKKHTAETVFKGIVMTKTLVFTFVIGATIMG